MEEYREISGETKTDKPNGGIRQMPEGFMEEEIALAGGEWQEAEECRGAVGFTMYDSPNSKDNTVTVLLPAEFIGSAASQSLVRIKSKSMKDAGGDGRQYLGAVVQGPFAEPDGLRADAPIVVTTTVRGARFAPRYHGRIQVEILGEEIDGTIVPPRFRPLPNSPVFVLNQEETIEKLRIIGEITLGLAVGYEKMPVSIPTRKDVLFRHVGILGTTGGGKSTTVSGLIGKLRDNDVAVIVFDTEGEYTNIMEPTEDSHMTEALKRRGMRAEGVSNVGLHHLVGRETAHEGYGDTAAFCLDYPNLSPYTVMEILSLNDAQQERFLKAYDIARRVLMNLKIYPASKEEQEELLELDEMERGFPRLTLQRMYDIVRLCADTVSGEEADTYLHTPEFRANRAPITKIIKGAKLPSNVWSWRKVQGSLSRLLRLGIFDNPVGSSDYNQMTQPGRVTIIDLSDTDSPQVNNLVISEILRGLHEKQDENYKASESKDGKPGAPIRKVMIVIEEAHEFLSAERIKQMPVLFQQVARIARRGRKRYLGLTFVTQLPQHLPDEVLGLINNYILHKIADANVISRLKRSIGGIDEGLWSRLPNLAPGQAIVTAASMARPLLVAVDPTPCKLRMIE